MSPATGNVSGGDQLRTNDIMKHAGSMAGSTKCCATGTCIVYGFAGMNAQSNRAQRDKIDPRMLAAQFGHV